MKILCVADEEEKGLWDYYRPGSLSGTDLIISCGDLDPAYLEFLVTMASCPLIYVRGNHDGRYAHRPPQGCVCIEERIYNFRGLRIAGLGGSMRYKPGAPNMYTEEEMKKRIGRLSADLFIHNGFDILVTHAPLRDYGDMEDLPHRGFACFQELLDRYHPMYMLHGHVHKSYGHFQRVRELSEGTKLINVCGSWTLELPKDIYPDQGLAGSPLYDLYMRLKRYEE